MPIEEEKTEIETRFEEFTDVLRKSGAGLIKLGNGKTLEEEFTDLLTENSKLNQRIEELETRKGDAEDNASAQITTNPNSVDTEELVEKLSQVFQRMSDLEEKIKNIGTVETEIDLKKEFKVTDIGNVSLKADEKKPAVNAEMLNKALKSAFMPDPKSTNRDGYELYPFGARTLNDEYTPRQ